MDLERLEKDTGWEKYWENQWTTSGPSQSQILWFLWHAQVSIRLALHSVCRASPILIAPNFLPLSLNCRAIYIGAVRNREHFSKCPAISKLSFLDTWENHVFQKLSRVACRGFGEFFPHVWTCIELWFTCSPIKSVGDNLGKSSRQSLWAFQGSGSCNGYNETICNCSLQMEHPVWDCCCPNACVKLHSFWIFPPPQKKCSIIFVKIVIKLNICILSSLC